MQGACATIASVPVVDVLPSISLTFQGTFQDGNLQITMGSPNHPDPHLFYLDGTVNSAGHRTRYSSPRDRAHLESCLAPDTIADSPLGLGSLQLRQTS